VDLNGKGPLIDPSADWLRSPATGRHRSPARERQRVRRRMRLPHTTRSRIRFRVWLACTGALLIMAVVIYLALGHEAPAESSALPHGKTGVAAAGRSAAISI
jgi:hypothetical protein